ncbi:DUF805 domain-containing protein [Brucella sp. BE17]|uniref:DUF805 domain-containing protein n=1 Tax=Brucella sp. BE17 TaxID=3142977 RepID=UPI0031BA0C63
MGFGETIRTVLRHRYAKFSGRASRSEYWWFQLFYWLVLLGFGLIFGVLMALFDRGQGFSSVYLIAVVPAAIFILALIVPVIAVQIRRFHDYNLSGWWYLLLVVLGFIPYVGILASIAVVVISVLKGTDGPNKFGADPLRPEATADVFA